MPPAILTEEQIQDIQLATLRAQVDECDRQIVAYLQQRFMLTDIIQQKKKEWGRPLLDSGRESVILSKMPKRFHDIYTMIFAESKKGEGWTGI